MKKSVLGAAIAAVLSVGPVNAGDADIFVFLENNPLQGVDVAINGKVVGQTNELGESSSYIDGSGNQVVTVEREGEQLSRSEFQLNADQDVEVSVVLSIDEVPRVNIFKTGEDALSAIGFLKGKVNDINGDPISGAYVSVDDTNFSFVTEANGAFSFDLPRGSYDMSISHSEYGNAELDDVRVVANIGTGAIVMLESQTASRPTLDIAAPIEEVIVLGSFSVNEDSTFSLEQMSTSVVDAIDIDQIIRFGDANVASALKRVVGVSIVDGKYAVVRGLDGRYIAATLNKNVMPTTNAFKRDAELDLYPADILGGIEIQKSVSADLPADSTAGTILIKTQDMPDDYINKLSVSFGYNTSVTGDDFYTSEDGNGNYFGFDNDFRALPSSVYEITGSGLDFSVCQIDGQMNCVSETEAAFAATRLRNIWEPKKDSASPDFGVAYTLGGVKDISEGTIGVYASASFDKENKSKVDAFLDSPLGREGEFSEDTIDTSLNGYLVAGFEFNDGSQIDSKTMVLRNTEDTTRIFSGFDNDEESEFDNVILEWKERQFVAQHFTGHHFIFQGQELDWRVGVSKTESDVPDRRSYIYNGDFLVFTTVERMWAALEEDATDLGLDYTLPLEFNADWHMDLKVGGLYNKKERENEIVRLGLNRPRISLNDDIETLLQPQTFFDDNLRLRTVTTDTDKYEAEQEVTAAYISTETHFNDLLTIVLGLRQESYDQSLNLPNRITGVQEVSRESDEIYPSLGVIYRPTEDWQVRFGYSETVSRPTLTEISPARFYNDRAQQFQGNENLIDSDITNLDLRVDYYFGDESNLSIALFHKDIANPVEVGVVDGSGSASSSRTWRNENEATLQGIELDVNTEFFNNGDRSAFVGGNITLIDSEVILTGDSQRLQEDDVRDLQGQSPVLANIQLGYDHIETGQKLTFLVNYFDDRIDQVTRSPEQVIFEKGRLTLDFNYELPLFEEKASLKVKLKNITNEDVVYEQDGRDIEGWKNGTKLTLDFSYNF